MAKGKRKRNSESDNKRTIKDNLKDAVKLSVQPPPRAITPPGEIPKKKAKKK
jgi:hypothetical protein